MSVSIEAFNNAFPKAAGPTGAGWIRGMHGKGWKAQKPSPLHLISEVLASRTGGAVPLSLSERIPFLFEKHKITHVVDIGAGDCSSLRTLKDMLGGLKVELTGVDLQVSKASKYLWGEEGINLLEGDAKNLTEVLKGEKADIILAYGMRTLRDFTSGLLWVLLNSRNPEKFIEELMINHRIASEMTEALSQNPSAFAVQMGIGGGDPKDVVILDGRRVKSFADVLYWGPGLGCRAIAYKRGLDREIRSFAPLYAVWKRQIDLLNSTVMK